MRAVRGSRTRLFPGRGARSGGERPARRGVEGGAVAVRALILGGAKSGKSARAERLAADLGGESVLYVATAEPSGDRELERRVRAHRERRPESWTTLEVGRELHDVPNAAARYAAVLVDSLTLWVSARMADTGDEVVLEGFDRFLEAAVAPGTLFILVSDEVGLGVVPESAVGRRFRDLLGEVNQRAASAASEVYLCVAGNALRVK